MITTLKLRLHLGQLKMLRSWGILILLPYILFLKLLRLGLPPGESRLSLPLAEFQLHNSLPRFSLWKPSRWECSMAKSRTV